MTKSIDNVGDGFMITAPFFPEDPIYRELYKPFKYQRVVIKINNQLQLTGRIEVVAPTLSAGETSVMVKGRSLTGSIVDCTFKYKDVQQFTDAKLDEIAKVVLKDFDFDPVFESPAGALFPEAGSSSPTQTIFAFLHNYAKQRDLLISQTPDGDLLFRKAITKGAPVANFVEGDVGLVVTTGSYNGTVRFSKFDVFGQEPDVNDNYAPVIDPALDGVHRPRSIQSNDTNKANIVDSANWIASATVAQAINVPLRVEGWTDPNGALWIENTFITLVAPSVMAYKPFTFLIKSVKFIQDSQKTYTTLRLTIPSAYTGELPRAYPWD
jgi:prophage tail gpP-like protein